MIGNKLECSKIGGQPNFTPLPFFLLRQALEDFMTG
jgi:hypothetical protein